MVLHPREIAINNIRLHPRLNCTEAWNISSRGFYVGVDPLKFTFPVLMLQLISIFVVSRTLHFFLRSFKQPRFVCDVLAAIIIGPSVLGKNKMFKDTSVLFPPSEYQLSHIMSTIGTIYFIFLIAVKLNITMILKTSGKKEWGIGISSIIVPLLTVGCFYFLVKLVSSYIPVFEPDIETLEVSLLLSMTAFTHVAQLLDEINLLTSELGQLAMSCAVVNDTIRMLILMVMVTARGIMVYGYPKAILILAVTILVTIFILRPIPLWIIKATPEGKPVREIYIVALLIGALFMGGLTHWTLKSPAVGAMIFGLIIPDGPPLGATIVQKTELIILEFLQPLIFVFLGFDMDLGSIKDWKLFGKYLSFVAVGCAGKIAGTLLPATLIHKMSFKNALSLGLAMNIKGVIEATGFQSWKHRERIDAQSYNILILSITAITAFVTPLLTSLHKPRERLLGSAKHRNRTLQSASTVSELRILLCIHDDESVGSLISILEASNPTDTCPINTYVMHLVELVGGDAPILLPYHKRGQMWKSSKSARIMRAFARYSEYTRNLVTIQPFTLVAPYKSMHEYICRVAQDKAIPFIIVPVRKDAGVDGGQANALRNLNNNLQDYAPCSVGILVHKGFNNDQIMRYKCFSYRVLVIFLGGADDREALAYGIRMSGHPNVSVTMLHIVMVTDNDGEESHTIERRVERKLNDSSVDDFKQSIKNIRNNGRGVYHEEVVEDIVHAIGLIQSLGSDYDLVMVGRRRVINNMFEKQMEVWSENPELGVIGDALVSSHSLGGMVSVMVIQHFGEIVDPLTHF